MQLGSTCLHLAVKEGEVAVVRQLVQLNCDLTIRDEVGMAAGVDFGQADNNTNLYLYYIVRSVCS